MKRRRNYRRRYQYSKRYRHYQHGAGAFGFLGKLALTAGKKAVRLGVKHLPKAMQSAAKFGLKNGLQMGLQLGLQASMNKYGNVKV